MTHPDLDTIPALEPPSGQESNLDDPYSVRRYVYITAAVTMSLSTIAVLLRLFTKARVLRRVQLEEYILVLSLIGFYAFGALMIQAAQLGQGTHQWNVSVAHVQRVVRLSNLIEIIYCPIILGAKVAMLLQMKRIFVVTRTGKLFWLLEILLWANIPCYLAIMLSLILACVPREKLWNPELPGHCISSNGSVIASSALNVVSDVTILLLPLMVIIRLHLPAKSKLILIVVFGTGALGCISSIMRLIYSVLLTRTHDFTWIITPVGLWALGEICSVILSGAIPMLPGFVKFVRGQDVPHSGPSSGNTSGSRRTGQSVNKETAVQELPDLGRSGFPTNDRSYEMGGVSHVHVGVASSKITKTIHIQTEYERV